MQQLPPLQRFLAAQVNSTISSMQQLPLIQRFLAAQVNSTISQILISILLYILASENGKL